MGIPIVSFTENSRVRVRWLEHVGRKGRLGGVVRKVSESTGVRTLSFMMYTFGLLAYMQFFLTVLA